MDLRPDAKLDIPEIAGRALVAMAFDSDGEPDLVLPAVRVVDQFLDLVLDRYPRERVGDYRLLKRILGRRPVSTQEVVAWYRGYCRGASRSG